MHLTIHSDSYFDNMISQIYLSKLQLYKANTSDNDATFLDMYLSISYDIVSTKFMINVMTLILKFSVLGEFSVILFYLPKITLLGEIAKNAVTSHTLICGLSVL